MQLCIQVQNTEDDESHTVNRFQEYNLNCVTQKPLVDEKTTQLQKL